MKRTIITLAEVVRRALGALTGGQRSLPFANLGRSGQAQVARDMESLLAERWAPHRHP